MTNPSALIAAIFLLLANAASLAQTGDTRGLKVRSAEQIGVVGYDPSRFHALVIGINDYSQWTKLRTAVNDATAVADALVSNYGFPGAQVRRLLNENATRRNILQELDRLSDLGPEDSVLIYYAGHGWMDRRKNGFWIPVDAPEDDKFAYVSNAQIVQECFKKYRVKHLLVVSDSCFSGALLRGKGVKRDANWKIPAGFQKPSRWVITSGDLAPVPDDAGTGHSPFATRLLQYLRYGDQPAFGIYDLFSFVKRNLESDAICEPLDTPAHMPGGEFVLARIDKPIAPPTLDKPLQPLPQTTPAARTGGLFAETTPAGALIKAGAIHLRLKSNIEQYLKSVANVKSRGSIDEHNFEFKGTSHIVDGIVTGMHAVAVDVTGGISDPEFQTVGVIGGSTQYVVFVVSPKPAVYCVLCNVDSALVYDDNGTLIGENGDLIRLPAYREHTLRVSAAGYQDQHLTVHTTHDDGSVNRLQVKLNRIDSISAIPYIEENKNQIRRRPPPLH